MGNEQIQIYGNNIVKIVTVQLKNVILPHLAVWIASYEFWISYAGCWNEREILQSVLQLLRCILVPVSTFDLGISRIWNFVLLKTK